MKHNLKTLMKLVTTRADQADIHLELVAILEELRQHIRESNDSAKKCPKFSYQNGIHEGRVDAFTEVLGDAE